jgi:hypothetical protein
VAVPVWVDGNALPASDLNNWLAPKVAVKSSSQSVTSSTTLVNDSALVLSVAANAVYEVTAHIVYDGSTAGDFKPGFTGPAGATLTWVGMGLGSGASTPIESASHNAQTLSDTGAVGALGAGTSLVVPIHGVLTTAGTAGNFQFQFAQLTSDATATRVLAGSTLILRRIG